MLLIRWSVMALGVTLATELVSGISCDDTATLIVVVLLLSFLNAVLKPLLVLFTLPFILVTMGFGIVLINALLFLLVSRLVGGFEVASFGSALLGAIIVSATSLLLNGLRHSPASSQSGSPRGREPRPPRDPDVIDV